MLRPIRVFVEVPVYREDGQLLDTRIQPITFDPLATEDTIGRQVKQVLGLATVEDRPPA
jgi:hypothetical protein